MDVQTLTEHLVELIRLTATDLPQDVEEALIKAKDQEEGRAKSTLEWMLKNAREARENSLPLCQDTGTLIFHVEHGQDISTRMVTEAARRAASEATKRIFLRPNAVDPISGKNSGDNTGHGAPYLHFEEVDKQGWLKVSLMLKGGGCENCGIQYSLPDSSLNAGRDMAGIKRCILDAALKAQGFGCAPGTLGVGVGGDRTTSYMESKLQFMRKLDDENRDDLLAQVEREMHEKVNELGIGPMGFGGKNSILGVKIGIRHRLPASFFVSVSYMCWAFRRHSMIVESDTVSYQ